MNSTSSFLQGDKEFYRDRMNEHNVEPWSVMIFLSDVRWIMESVYESKLTRAKTWQLKNHTFRRMSYHVRGRFNIVSLTF